MIKDLTNKKFNRLKVIKLAYVKNNRAFWECECECGNIKVVRSDNLQNGSIKSCGCWHDEVSGNRFKKHGFCGTKIYKCWESMKARCTNPKLVGYKDYGGRGIKICDEWLADFMNFYNWAMGNGYNDSLSIDRIDVNGNYEPSNCRWVTMKVQAKNKRTCHYISYKGETHCISEWLEILGIKNRTIANKLYNGYPLEKIIEHHTRY